MKEVWKNISGYEGLYQVSNLGRVKSLDRGTRSGRGRYARKGQILKPYKNGSGYLRVDLYKNDGTKQRKTIHRLVCEAFLSNPNNLPEINHKDENKENNAVSNLEWCTPKQNCNYGTRTRRIAKKKLKPVAQFSPNGELLKIWSSSTECSKHGFDSRQISACCHGKHKTHKGYIWEFISKEVQ